MVLLQVDADPDVMVEGQSGRVFGIAPYPDPQKPYIYASGCEDGCVYMWNAMDRQCLKSFQIRRWKPMKGAWGTAEAGEVLRVKAVTFSHQSDYFALSTAGVLKPDDADEEWESSDKGGVIQIFTTDAEWLQVKLKR